MSPYFLRFEMTDQSGLPRVVQSYDQNASLLLGDAKGVGNHLEEAHGDELIDRPPVTPRLPSNG